MQFIFRTQKNTETEIELGHKLSFTVADGADAISVSSNSNGFTPLTAAFRSMYLDPKSFEDQIRDCRKTNKVIDLKNQIFSIPKIILVPPTRGITGKNKAYEYYAVSILEICNLHRLKNLHFTHYGFLNGGFDFDEVQRAMTTLLHPLIFTTLEKIYFEIDYRYLNEFINIYKYVNSNFNMRKKFSQVEAPEFEYITRQTLADGSTWQEFVRKDFERN